MSWILRKEEFGKIQKINSCIKYYEGLEDINENCSDNR